MVMADSDGKETSGKSYFYSLAIRASAVKYINEDPKQSFSVTCGIGPRSHVENKWTDQRVYLSALSAFINATSHTMMPKPGATHSTARDASEPIRRRNLLLQTSRPPASQVLAPESSSPGMGGGFLKPGEHGGVVRPPFFSSLGSALRPSSYGSPFGAAFGDPLQTGNLRIGGSSIESSTRPAPLHTVSARSRGRTSAQTFTAGRFHRGLLQLIH